MAGTRAPPSHDEGAETPVLLALLPAGSSTGDFSSSRKLFSGRFQLCVHASDKPGLIVP
jgi:hypothetical protein